MYKTIARKLVGGLARFLGLLVALALLVPALLILYTTTDDFRSRLLEHLVLELDGRMAGEPSIAALEGSPLRALRFRNVALSWHGEEIARIASVSVEVDWTALLAGRFRIARVELEGPDLVLRKHATLGWDWREALAPLIRAPGDPRPPRSEPLPIVIETLALSQGRLQIAPKDRPPIQLEGIDLRGRVDFGERRFTLEQASLASGDSKLRASGDVPFEGRFLVDVAIESLDPRDLARIDPALADALAFLSPASGSLVLSGEKDSLDASGQLLWPEAKLGFDVHGNPNELTLARSTLAARLEARDLARFLPKLALAGQLDLQLELVHGEGTFSAKLRHAPRGELDVDGTFSPVGLPEAKVRFETAHFDLARAWPGHPQWTGSLTGSGMLSVRGRDRDSLAGTISVALDSSQIGELKLHRGSLRAKLENNSIDLAELSFEGPIGRATVHGRLATEKPGPLSLKGRIDVDDLGPLLALARRRGEGSLHGRIDVDGQLERARVAADLTLADFRLDDFRTERARLVFAARGGLKGESVDALIETFRLETALGIWQLEQAARLQTSRDSLQWESVRLSNGEAVILLDGRLARRGRQSFRLEARALPIATWARAFPNRVSPEILVAGVLDLDLAVGGTAVAPILAAHFVPRGLVLSEKSIEKAEAELHFAARRARASLSASSSPLLRIDAEAEIPFELAWQDGFVARARGELAAKADCEANDLAILAPFVEAQVENLGGRARCRLELAGPLDDLRPSGEVTFSELTARPRRTGITVVAGELAVELAADRFFVRRASATVAGHEETARFRAEGDGPLPAFLTRLTRPTQPATPPPSPTSAGDYTTKIELERWPLVETKRDRLIASGVLSARGSFEAPRIEGKVTIVEGTLRPNLAFLSSGPPPRDATLVFEQDESISRGPSPNGGTNDPSTQGSNLLSTFEALELEVDVDVGRDLWIKHEQAEVLLSGRVEARKRRDKPLSLEGRIEAQQGFADLQNRRFRLIEGNLELVGGAKIDPLLDVLARYRAPAHTIDARLTGTASKPVLTLSSDPELSQEDILAVLLFGRPAGELSQAQQASLGQQAEEMASAFGITAVGRTVANAIGLDALGLQIEELSSVRARLGAYVGRNIFVALGQEFSGERGQELAIEYEFWPGWSLVGSTTSQGTNSADLVWKIRY